MRVPISLWAIPALAAVALTASVAAEQRPAAPAAKGPAAATVTVYKSPT